MVVQSRVIVRTSAFCIRLTQCKALLQLSFGIALLVGLDDVTAMGLLTIGSCPGGGGSNILAYILDADLELSITMTFISTLAALGLKPIFKKH